tara:strand:- start:575 stop:892 length:318 start_codon:yes stop_codon:yes gene_type:complete
MWKPDPKPEPKQKKKAKAISKVSKSRKLDLKLYEQARDEYLNNNPICNVCNEAHTDCVHHKAGRIGSLLYNPRYFLAVCGACHDTIENNPEWAKEMGFSVIRTKL